MAELWLTFTDPEGAPRRVAIGREKFAVGRHSANDLSIPDGRLSREHLKIERFGDLFVASDCGSSNGTTLNGARLDKPTALKNGDSLDLGGLLMRVELASDNFRDAAAASDFDDEDDSTEPKAEGEKSQSNDAAGRSAAALPAASKTQNTPPAAAGGGSIPTSFFYLAPLFGLLVLLLVGGIVYISREKSGPDVVEHGGNFVRSRNHEGDPPEVNANADETPTNSPSPAARTENAAPTPEPSTVQSPTPKNSGDAAKIEQNSAAFLRQIAQNDPRAFLSSDQAQLVGVGVKQLSGSAALADNLRSAKAAAAQIRALAAPKNLKPQLLAVAALAKLGGARGNVPQTAQAMAEVLEKLSIQVGSERADDALLLIAVYDQGAAGDFLKMRNLLQQLSNQFPESSRTIRTIWFLRKNGKLTDAEFEFALRFLAIGTIAQNPKDFGVNAEELKLN